MELVFFMLGLFTGLLIAMVTLAVMGMRLSKKMDRTESVSKRMLKVKELTKEQLELQAQTSLPQKNALHGRYKNGVIGRIKELEEEKNTILKSIITDGFDPEITVMDESGVVTSIKLSEYLGQNGITMPPKETTPPKTNSRQIGKFTVHKGGKDDGGGETVH